MNAHPFPPSASIRAASDVMKAGAGAFAEPSAEELRDLIHLAADLMCATWMDAEDRYACIEALRDRACAFARLEGVE